jgi:hypothetical protein
MEFAVGDKSKYFFATFFCHLPNGCVHLDNSAYTIQQEKVYRLPIVYDFQTLILMVKFFVSSAQRMIRQTGNDG